MSVEQWVSVKQIAEHLGLAPITIYRWIASNHIPHHRVGRQVRFDPAEVDKWVKKQRLTTTDDGYPSN